MAFVLGGCAVAPPQPAEDAAAAEVLRRAREVAVRDVKAWAFTGRAAVRGEGLDPRSVRLSWEAAGARHRLAFLGPLGQRLAELELDEAGAVLHVPDELPRRASSPERLLTDLLGWAPPLASLADWVRGLPDPDRAMAGRQLDSGGRLLALEQAGWEVEFDRWRTVSGLDLPGRLRLKHPGLQLRLVVDGWQLGSRAARR